MLKFALLVISH